LSLSIGFLRDYGGYFEFGIHGVDVEDSNAYVQDDPSDQSCLLIDGWQCKLDVPQKDLNAVEERCKVAGEFWILFQKNIFISVLWYGFKRG